MRPFQLQDCTGKFVMCIALGRHSENELLEDYSEVVVYFATAQAGLGNEPGKLWVYDESHIVRLRQRCKAPSARTIVALGSSASWG